MAEDEWILGHLHLAQTRRLGLRLRRTSGPFCLRSNHFPSLLRACLFYNASLVNRNEIFSRNVFGQGQQQSNRLELRKEVVEFVTEVEKTTYW